MGLVLSVTLHTYTHTCDLGATVESMVGVETVVTREDTHCVDTDGVKGVVLSLRLGWVRLSTTY